MSITLKDIASELGLSHMTVSRAIRGSDLIAPATRERVMRAVRDRGYLPNSSARSLNKGRLDAVGLLTPSDGPPSAIAASLPGILGELRERNMHLTIAEQPTRALVDHGFMPKILREYAVAGLLVNYVYGVPPELEQILERCRIASIWLNSKRDTDAVRPDDYTAARDATQRFVALGHRRIAFVAHAVWTHYSSADRFAGYCDAMRASGLEPIDLRIQSPHISSPAVTTAFDQAWLSRPQDVRPTALVCNQGQLDVAFHIHRHGLRIPQDISMVVFSEEQQRLGESIFDTLAVPFGAMGREGVRLLLDKLDVDGEPVPTRLVPVPLQEGTTVGPLS